MGKGVSDWLFSTQKQNVGFKSVLKQAISPHLLGKFHIFLFFLENLAIWPVVEILFPLGLYDFILDHIEIWFLSRLPK